MRERAFDVVSIAASVSVLCKARGEDRKTFLKFYLRNLGHDFFLRKSIFF